VAFPIADKIVDPLTGSSRGPGPARGASLGPLPADPTASGNLPCRSSIRIRGPWTTTARHGDAAVDDGLRICLVTSSSP